MILGRFCFGMSKKVEIAFEKIHRNDKKMQKEIIMDDFKGFRD